MDLDHPDAADQHLQRQQVDAGRAVEKMTRRIDMGPECALMCTVETFELSPREIRLVGSRLNGVFRDRWAERRRGEPRRR